MTSGEYAEGSLHEAVGAYALGILDDAEATAFEAHLAGCEACAAELDDLAGMEPMLATLREFPGPAAQPLRPVPPGMTTGLINEVAAQRARRRRRTTCLVAAAAALIVGGPAVAVVATSSDTGTHQSAQANQSTRPRTPLRPHDAEGLRDRPQHRGPPRRWAPRPRPGAPTPSSSSRTPRAPRSAA